MTTEAFAQCVLLYLFTKLSEPISVTINVDDSSNELAEPEGDVDVNKQEILNFYRYINAQVKLDRKKFAKEIADEVSRRSSHRGLPLPVDDESDIESSHSYLSSEGETVTVHGKIVFKQTESGLRTAIYTSFLDQKLFSSSQSFRSKHKKVKYNEEEVYHYSDDENDEIIQTRGSVRSNLLMDSRTSINSHQVSHWSR